MVALPSTKPENGGEVSIKYDKGRSTMVLSSTKRDALLAVSVNDYHLIETNTFNSICDITNSAMRLQNPQT
jgi:hypothetical protein